MKSLPRRGAFMYILVPGIILLAAIIGIYWKVMGYPLIQDDWFIVGSISRAGVIEFVKDAFGRFDSQFYRPLGDLFFAVNYSLFRYNSAGFHTVALFVHFLNALLVARIAYEMTSDEIVAWMAAFIFASSVTIHLDTLLWMVGVFDVGGTFFFLLSCLCFLKGRRDYSAISFCAALLMKEATIATPLVLFVLGIFIKRHDSNYTFSRIIRFISPHLVLLAVYLALRFQSIMALSATNTFAYSMAPFGPHLLQNVGTYATWLLDAIAPVADSPRSAWFLAVLLLALVLLQWKVGKSIRLTLILSACICIGLIPVIFLTHHAYKYYLIYSLPWFSILVSTAVRAIATSFGLTDRYVVFAAVALLAANVSISLMYFRGVERNGFDAPPVEGTNNLIRKGWAVSQTKSLLESEGPNIPKGSQIIFNGMPTSCFGWKTGPNLWCRDSTITVYEIEEDSTGIHLTDPTDPEFNEPLSSFRETAYVLSYRGNKLELTRLRELK